MGEVCVLKRIVIAVCLFFSLNSFASTNLFTGYDFWPAVGPSDYFSVSNSHTLHQWQPTLGLFNTYAFNPVQTVNVGGVKTGNMIEHNLIHFVSGGIGLTDWWQIGLMLPVVSGNLFTNPNVVGSTAGNRTDIGDFRASMKFHLVKGLALEAFGTAPTGAASHYMGENSYTGGGKLIADFHPVERLKLALNAGMSSQQPVVFSKSLDYSERFWGGIGAAVALTSNLDFLAEGTTTTSFKHFFSNRSNSPAEVDAGLRWRPSHSGFALAAGGGTCIICNAKAPTVRANLGIDYFWQTQKVEAKKEKQKTVSAPTQTIVFFESNRSVIPDEGARVLGRAVDIWRTDPKIQVVVVEGHADSVGSDAANLQLAKARVAHVIHYLKLRGIPDSISLTPIALGKEKPLAPNDTPEGQARNRCVILSSKSGN